MSAGKRRSYTWNDEGYSLYGEVAARSSLKDFGDSYAVNGKHCRYARKGVAVLLVWQ
ncbi:MULTISPECIES: hypothetical protein [unclassified Rhizobium]|jgi:hypothetical protein|uniref:hypothetical protein n=1 Tax=unclassified Rhizobium TaxID=2613769 RepID=UPI0013AFD836|nr:MULTISPECIES: hypothetical protein [unclassified Rhizobium]MBB3447007.1 hypothetical protein [Rhizobium sp. BK379]MBB3565547.1 hypothetical protein [Rhizobium sp. BK512]